MVEKSITEIENIIGIVKAINECWRLKDYDGIGSYLAEDVVIAPPNSVKRIHGRAAYVQSYRDYDQSAETLEYITGDPRVDVVGDIAVADCPFEVVYKLLGVKHHEKGQNILVFWNTQGRWKIVWRMMKFDTIPTTIQFNDPDTSE